MGFLIPVIKYLLIKTLCAEIAFTVGVKNSGTTAPRPPL